MSTADSMKSLPKSLLISYLPMIVWLAFIASFAVIAFFYIEPEVPDFGTHGEHILMCVALGQIKPTNSLSDYNFIINGSIRSYSLVSVGDRLASIFRSLFSMSFPYSTSEKVSTLNVISPCMVAYLAELGMIIISCGISYVGLIYDKWNKTSRNIVLIIGGLFFVAAFILAPYIKLYAFAFIALAHILFSIYISSFRLGRLKHWIYCFGMGFVMLLSFSLAGTYSEISSLVTYVKQGFVEKDARLAYVAIIFFGLTNLAGWLLESCFIMASCFIERKKRLEKH